MCACLAVSYLEGVIGEVEEARQGRTEQPLLFLRMHVAQYQLLLGQLKACQEACGAGKATLDLLNNVRWPRHLNASIMHVPRHAPMWLASLRGNSCCCGKLVAINSHDTAQGS